MALLCGLVDRSAATLRHGNLDIDFAPEKEVHDSQMTPLRSNHP